MTNPNKETIQQFYEAQNRHEKPCFFAKFFTRDYLIEDVGIVDVPIEAQHNIADRISAFQKQFPGYQCQIKNIICENNDVFVWFKAVSSEGKLLLDSFVVFTLENKLIRKAVEMVVMNSQT